MLVNNSKILICFGTRPEYIKLLPIMKEMDKRSMPYKILFTGQHKDVKFEYVDYKFMMYDKFYRLSSITG
jgi:UDP-N-acetylglucosamine 2-epimerase